MLPRHHKLALLAGTALLSITATHGAQASGFALREQSAYQQGWSFAGAAAGGPGLSGMYWNPALVTNAETITFDTTYTLIVPQVHVTPDPGFALSGLGGSGDMGQDAIVPASTMAAPITDKITLGLSINTPFGLATNPRNGWSGQLDATSSKVMSLNFTPTIGWKVNDWLSIGAGLQLQQFKTTLKQNTGVGGPRLAIEGEDDLGVGFTAGFTIKPMDGTEFGVGFRSSVEHDIEGDVRLGAALFKAYTNTKLPEIVSVGLRQRITNAFTLAGTFEWTNWSRIGTLTMTGPGSAIVSALPFNYKDTWFASVGGEYAWSPELMLRAGFAYETSPIDFGNRNTRLPDNNRIWLSAGMSYNWSEKLSVDLGYSYVTILGGKAPIQTTAPGPVTTFIGEAEVHSHTVALGFRYKFGAPAKAAMAEPLVRKY